MPDRITQIPAPRVPFVDAQTGLVNREWYRFLYNLYNITGQGTSDISTVDLALQPVMQPSVDSQTTVIKETVDTLPAPQEVIIPDGWEKEPREPVIFPDAWEKFPPQEPLQNKNECCENLEKQPIPQLGTFAALQQANLQWTTFARDPGPYPSTVPGTIYWDNEDRSKTLAVIMEDTGSIVQDIGEETFYRVKADSTITKGQVVMFTGGLGASGGLKAAPATGLTARQAESILGIATQNIATNAWGYVTWFGEIKGIDTRGLSDGGWVDGTLLYYNPAVTGGLTKTRPALPNVVVVIAAVVHAASNGILFVRPTWEDGHGEIVTTPPYVKTANFAVADSDTWLINNKSGSTCTVTLPAAASYIGRVLTFQNWQNQLLISASANVIPQGGGAAQTGILLNVAGNWATLVSNGTNWVIMQAADYNNLLIE